MRKTIQAIALTIPDRLVSGWAPPLMTLGYSMMGLQILWIAKHHSQRFNYCAISGTAVIVGLLAFHFKQLIMDAKGRLLPGAPRIPLAVASIMAAIYLIGMPLLVHAIRPAPLLAQTAMIWLVAAAALYSVIRNSGVGMILGLGFYFAAIAANSTFQNRVADVVEAPSIAYLLIVISIAWMLLTTRQLSRMTEESPGYQPLGRRQVDWNVSPGSTSEATQVWRDPGRAKWLALAAPAQRRLHQATQTGASDTLWKRCRRWRSVSPQQYWIWGMTLFLSSMLIWSNPNSSPLPSGAPPMLFAPMIILLGLIPVATTGHFAQQWRYRTIDLLKPLRREDFLREMGLCLAIDLFLNMFVMALLLAIMVMFFAPAQLHQFSFNDLLLITLLAVSATVLVFGFLVWFLRYRLTVVIGLLSPMVIMPPAIMASRASLPTALLVAAGMALAGLGLTYHAYRRWLLTDLG